MTDKIKVWKCDGCGACDDCYVFFINPIRGHEPLHCICNPNIGPRAQWQLNTDYEITERKPTQIDASVMSTLRPLNHNLPPEPELSTIKAASASIKKHGVPPYLKQVIDDLSPPPRRRVKIIWSEVTAENVRVASALCEIDPVFDTNVLVLHIPGSNRGLKVSDIPKSWLEDIDDEPVSPEQAWNDFKDGHENWGIADIFIAGFLKGETNEQKRYLPTMSFDEWNKKDNRERNEMLTAYEHRKLAWQARGESNNLPMEPK